MVLSYELDCHVLTNAIKWNRSSRYLFSENGYCMLSTVV